MTSPHLKAVIFDIGGVVLRSPLLVIAAFEDEKRLPRNYINCSITMRGPDGAWQRFERGEMSLFPFYDAFGRELSDTTNGNIWYIEYCKRHGLECPPLPGHIVIDGREVWSSSFPLIRLPFHQPTPHQFPFILLPPHPPRGFCILHCIDTPLPSYLPSFSAG